MRRFSLILCASLLAVGMLPAWSAGPSPVAPSAPWPQAISDLPADPAVRFGTLSNGMRYAILPNHMPKGQVSLRLRIDAGALQESEQQRGLAHFIEHMAFRGSTHVPDNEAFRILERFGAALGADSNAFTTQSETVFKIDLPKNDPAGIDTALMLMRETGGELTFSEQAVDSERSVVLSEERVGDTPVARVAKDELAFVYKDQLIGNRLPIGSVDVLNAARANDLRRFYDAYYRPERATLVVAGDIAPDMLERKIKQRFGQWRGRGPAGSDPVYGSPLPRGQEIASHIEAGAATTAGIEWTRPIDPRPDSKARDHDRVIALLGLQIFNQRLDDMRLAADPPFLRAYASFQQVGKSAQLTALGLATTEQGWRAGLEAVLRAQRTLLATGVTQAELDREIINWRSRLENGVASASTRRSSALANDIVGTIDRAAVFGTPAASLAQFNAILPDATVAAVNQALRQLFSGNGPLLFLGGPQPMEGAEAIMADSAKEPPPPPAASSVPESWPYTQFGPAGLVVERHEEPDLGITMLRFANGVRLTVKPTQFHADQILVSADVGHGRLDIAKDTAAPVWIIGSGAFLLGGYQAVSVPEFKRLMSGKQAGVSMALGDNALRFSGTTRPQDFATELQMMAAYLTAPGWRPEGLELVRNNLINAIPQWQTSPSGVYARHAAQLLRNGDPRWHSPDIDQVRAVQFDEMRKLIEPILDSAPVELEVVGDITVEKAVEQVAATLGALPPRDAETPSPKANREVSFPAPTAEPIVLHHRGRGDQGLAVAAWPAADDIEDIHTPRAVRILQLILQQRLMDEFRTKLGDSYSPGTDMESSLDFPGYGFMLAYAETPESKMAVFDETLSGIVRDLRENTVSTDEFERARKPRIETLLKSRQTNEYWLGALHRAQSNPRRLELIRTAIPDLERLTPADIRQTAENILRDDHLWRLRITPEPANP